jgi:hypothetical protein
MILLPRAITKLIGFKACPVIKPPPPPPPPPLSLLLSKKKKKQYKERKRNIREPKKIKNCFLLH